MKFWWKMRAWRMPVTLLKMEILKVEKLCNFDSKEDSQVFKLCHNIWNNWCRKIKNVSVRVSMCVYVCVCVCKHDNSTFKVFKSLFWCQNLNALNWKSFELCYVTDTWHAWLKRDLFQSFWLFSSFFLVVFAVASWLLL